MPDAKRRISPDRFDANSSGWADYELLDSGNQEKLERFGSYRLIRFEPEAVWKPALNPDSWASADARFSLKKGQSQGKWSRQSAMPDEWPVRINSFRLNLFLKNSRHVGIFPEQYPNWEWMESTIKKSRRKLNVLNLFAYTGAATLFAAGAGAEVTHVEAARSSLSIARKNLEDSGLADRPVRWIVDDALKFVQREMRRGSRYDAIIMDPPKFGRGPGGEVWKFENSIDELVHNCAAILSDHPVFFMITAYNVNTRAPELGNILMNRLSGFQGKVQCGNLVQLEKSAGRKINQAIYARWENMNMEV